MIDDLASKVDWCVDDFVREYRGRKPTNAFVNIETFNELREQGTSIQTSTGYAHKLKNKFGFSIHLHRLRDEHFIHFGKRLGIDFIGEMKSPMILTRERRLFKKYRFEVYELSLSTYNSAKLKHR